MKYPHFNWIRFVIDSPNLPFHAKGIALYLYTYMNGHQDMAWPSLARIERDLQLARNTVIKYLQLLERLHFLEVEKRPNRSNVYKATLPDDPALLIPMGSARREPPSATGDNGGAPREPGSASSEPLGVQDVNPNNTGNSQKNITDNPRRSPHDWAPPSENKLEALKKWISQLEKMDPARLPPAEPPFDNELARAKAELEKLDPSTKQMQLGD